MKMFPVVRRGLVTLGLCGLLGAVSCAPKPASEPTSLVEVAGDNQQLVKSVEDTIDFAENNGYVLLGSKPDNANINWESDIQLYRLDSQILILRGAEDGKFLVGFYKSGGPVSKTEFQIRQLSDSYLDEFDSKEVSVSYIID